MCEGGGQLGSALLAAGLVDRLYAFVAPVFFGEPGVLAFQGARGKVPLSWRTVGRKELGNVMVLVLGPKV